MIHLICLWYALPQGMDYKHAVGPKTMAGSWVVSAPTLLYEQISL